jgi:hypothetical protein
MKCKPVNTSLSVSKKLLAYEGYVLRPEDATCYRSLVGVLQHLDSDLSGLSIFH